MSGNEGCHILGINPSCTDAGCSLGNLTLQTVGSEELLCCRTATVPCGITTSLASPQGTPKQGTTLQLLKRVAWEAIYSSDQEQRLCNNHEVEWHAVWQQIPQDNSQRHQALLRLTCDSSVAPLCACALHRSETVPCGASVMQGSGATSACT